MKINRITIHRISLGSNLRSVKWFIYRKSTTRWMIFSPKIYFSSNSQIRYPILTLSKKCYPMIQRRVTSHVCGFLLLRVAINISMKIKRITIHQINFWSNLWCVKWFIYQKSTVRWMIYLPKIYFLSNSQIRYLSVYFIAKLAYPNLR